MENLPGIIAYVVGQGVVALSAGCEIHLAVEQDGADFDGKCYVRHPQGDDLPDTLLRSLHVAGCIAESAFLRGFSPASIEPIDVLGKLQSGEIELPCSVDPKSVTLAEVSFALDSLGARWATVVAEVDQMTPEILNNATRPH